MPRARSNYNQSCVPGRRRKPDPDWEEVTLEGEIHAPRKRQRRRRIPPPAPSQQLWTTKKALLIHHYLFGFVMVTRDGTYIDGFAGWLHEGDPDSWAANLVLELRPPLLKHFFLFELSNTKIGPLEELRARHHGNGRTVEVFHEDFNAGVDRVLRPEVISMKEPTFCLVDQQTAECNWATLERLASYKREADYKIELFYFLADAWLNRVLETTTREKSRDRLRAWWGRESYYEDLRYVPGAERGQLVANRFQEELGYQFATPYAIYDPEHPSRVMFYMVHGTDHPRAPDLMRRAYRSIVDADPKESWEQLRLA